MRIIKKCSLLVLGLVLLLHYSFSEKPLADKKLIEALKEISGEIAYHYVSLITKYDRIQASKGFHEAVLMIKKELEKIGYSDIKIENWFSNGSTFYYTYRTPIGWKAKKAELWMISPQKVRLCSYKEIPLTLVKHSNSAHVTAELIDVGSGIGEDSYKGKDVKGKIVLATGYTGRVMREAIKRGAIGVITWYSPEVRPGYPNMIRYTAIWPKWEEREKIGFAFNISKIQGWKLKKFLDEGKKVVLKADVETEFYESKVEILTASLPGSIYPDEQILIIGHLCHPMPSANDNASGSGGMLEMARALKTMIDKGLISPPKRTIRFLWVPEFAGTIPYVKDHFEEIRKTIAVINCDMIGEDFCKTRGVFTIIQTPDSLPSFLNDVVINFAKLASKLNLTSINGSKRPFLFRIAPFSGGSDHYIFNDGLIKVPSVMLGHNDIFHHTNLDNMDKVDSSELRRACFIALGSAIYLANAEEREAINIARLVLQNGIARLTEDYYKSLELLLKSNTDKTKLYEAYKQVLNVIEHSLNREIEAVKSTLIFSKNINIKNMIKNFTQHLSLLANSFKKECEKLYKQFCKNLKIKPLKPKINVTEKKFSRIIPIRNKDIKGPIFSDYLELKLEQQELEKLKKIKIKGVIAYEAVNFINGKRSIYDIARAVSAEFGPINITELFEYFKLLEKAELLKLIIK